MPYFEGSYVDEFNGNVLNLLINRVNIDLCGDNFIVTSQDLGIRSLCDDIYVMNVYPYKLILTLGNQEKIYTSFLPIKMLPSLNVLLNALRLV